MSHIATSFLAVLVALFPIVNPLGMIPVFIQLTEGADDRLRAALARRIAFNGLMLMIGALLVGSQILAFFGLTVPAVQIAGGLVVVSTGWRLLYQGDAERTTPREKVLDELMLRRAFFPMTMPLTVGPGTISVAIAVGARSADSDAIVFDGIGALVASLIVAISIYICYRYGARITRLLGPDGTDVFVRLSAFILMCLGVQILWNGLATFVSLNMH